MSFSIDDAELCIDRVTTYPALLIPSADAWRLSGEELSTLLIERAVRGSTLAQCSALLRSGGKLVLNTTNVARADAKPSFQHFVRVSVPVFGAGADALLPANERCKIVSRIDTRLGYCKMFIFVAPVQDLSQVADFSSGASLAICAALSVAPWFRVREHLPPMNLGVTREDVDLAVDVRRLSMSYPILPALHTAPPPGAEWLSDKDFSGVYAFALAWHAHSQKIARRDRVVPREVLLTRVSERFFARGAAGPALFSTPIGSHRMTRAVARLRTPRAHHFLAHTLASALSAWCELCEKRCYRELSMIDLVRGSLAPACKALVDTANAVHLPTDVCNAFAAIFDDPEVNLLTAQECVSGNKLSRADALYLAGEAGNLPECDDESELSDDAINSALHATVVLVHRFGTGLEFVDIALLGDGGNVLMKTSSVMRNGWRYLPAIGNAREMLKHLFRWLLLAHAGAAPTDVHEASDADESADEDDNGVGNVDDDEDVDEFEALLLAALPDVDDSTCFADERCTQFDDRWPGATERRGPIERYDLAADLGLQRSTRTLAKRKRAGVDPLSLSASLGVLHSNACHGPLARGGHLDIDYSQGREASGEKLRRALLVHGREIDPAELLRLLYKQTKTPDTGVTNATTSTSQTSVAPTTLAVAPTSMHIDPPESALGCMHDDALHADKIGDIEDLVANAHANHALPLCMERFAQKLLIDKEHLQNRDRQLYYRLLRSTALPELSHERTVRHLLRATTNSAKLTDQWRDVNKGFETMLDTAHQKAAEGYQSTLRENGRDCTAEEALRRTTCAPSCSTMKRAKGDALPGCPFAWSNRRRVRQLLVNAGIDDVRADAISQRAPSAASEACRLHAMAAHTESATSPAPEALRNYSAYGFKHPYEFVHCSAKIILDQREQS